LAMEGPHAEDPDGHGGVAKDSFGPPAEPMHSWAIVDGRLYMNANPTVLGKWRGNVQEFIKDVDAMWIGWYGKLDAGPFNTECLASCYYITCNCAKYPQPMPPKLLG